MKQQFVSVVVEYVDQEKKMRDLGYFTYGAPFMVSGRKCIEFITYDIKASNEYDRLNSRTRKR